jgi:membrane-bound metal-dependent hydrolase YbcI (DUF457 family)
MQKEFQHGKIWLVMTNGLFLVDFCTIVTENLLWIVQKGFSEKYTKFVTFWGIKLFLPFLDNEFLQITTSKQDAKKTLMFCLTSKFGSLTKKNLGYNTNFIIYSIFFELRLGFKGIV